jgi:hypothetical protein
VVKTGEAECLPLRNQILWGCLPPALSPPSGEHSGLSPSLSPPALPRPWAGGRKRYEKMKSHKLPKQIQTN